MLTYSMYAALFRPVLPCAASLDRDLEQALSGFEGLLINRVRWLRLSPVGSVRLTFTLNAMKLILFPALFISTVFISTECISCELAAVDEVRKTVEEAFISKSFSIVSKKYGEAQSIELKVENEYDKNFPISIHKFNNVTELSKWFFEQHQHTENMLIPDQVSCTGSGCDYELPERTLHHGTYLQGFKSKEIGQCTQITEVYIYWA